MQSLSGISDEVERQKKAFEDANGTLDGFSLSLDQSTASGSANAAMLSQVAGAAQNAAQKQFEVDSATVGSDQAAKNYAATLADQRAKFEAAATAAGFSADQVRALADQVFRMPSAKELEVIAKTAQAEADLNYVARGREAWITMRVANVAPSNDFGQLPGNANGAIYSAGVKSFANGGFSPGIYNYVPGGIHKFAEEYDEAYISMDPARRARSEAVWVETGRRFGMLPPSGAAASEVRVDAPQVRVFIGDEEITGRVRVVVRDEQEKVARSARRGNGR